MANKNNPTDNDCYDKAELGEEYFVLLARDEAAPHAIRKWVDTRLMLGHNEPDDQQIQEALDCAVKMDNWRIKNEVRLSLNDEEDKKKRQALREIILRNDPSKGAPSSTFYGLPITELSRQELMAMIEWLGGQNRTMRERYDNMAKKL